MKPSAADGTTRAIIDASSAILLYKAGLIHIYCRSVQLTMARSVFEEVTVPRQCGAGVLYHLAGRQPGIIVLDELGNSGYNAPIDDIYRLDQGERETILHYLDGAAHFVVIDDGRGVRVCRRYGIPHVNALLVPKLLYFSKRLSMDQMNLFFSRLCALGRYSVPVVEWAKKCEAGQLDYFLSDEKCDKKLGRR